MTKPEAISALDREYAAELITELGERGHIFEDEDDQIVLLWIRKARHAGWMSAQKKPKAK